MYTNALMHTHTLNVSLYSALRSLVRPQTCQCRCLRLHPLGRLPAGARPSVCHLERDEPAFTLLLSAWLTMTVSLSI